MTRRASRPGGSRTRRPSQPRAKLEPLQHIRALLAARASESATGALDRWVDAIAEFPEEFNASVRYLAQHEADGFTTDERWLLLSIAMEMAEDPMLSDACEELELRIDAEARAWPGYDTGDLNYEQMRAELPAYAAVSDAWSALRTYIEVHFLHELGMHDMARSFVDSTSQWERRLRDGEATLLGVPRIVLSADDDPFGILLT